MFEPLRILGLLLHKNWLLRRNSRLMMVELISEILTPVVLVFILTGLSSLRSGRPAEEGSTDTRYRAYSLQDLIDLATKVSVAKHIFYAPNNSFTNELMRDVHECFKRRADISGFPKEFMAFYYGSRTENTVVVIFDESLDRSAKHLSYKLRSKNLITTLRNNKTSPKSMTEYYTITDHLAQTQICLDRSFVNAKSGKKQLPDLRIQRMPYPARIHKIPFDRQLRLMLPLFLIIAFLFSLVFEIMEAVNEKLSDAIVLLSIHGISNTLNLLSLIIFRLLLLTAFSVLLILLFLSRFSDYQLSFMHYGDITILFFILVLYLAHLLTFGIHVSAYFWKAWPVSIALMMLNISMTILCYTTSRDGTIYKVPYLGVIFPDILLLQAMEEIRVYEDRAEGVHWDNLFENANPGCSVGAVLILFIIGTILHFLLAVYVYAINPGKYGVAKHPLYFLKFSARENYGEQTDISNDDGKNDRYFESTRGRVGSYIPGIQIRNLHKVYNIGSFKKKKVDALQGVSVDFYKGQITALLGHNGAGKTTLMSILTGTTNPTEGTVFINSRNLKENTSEIVKDMGVCTQENLCFPRLTLWQQLLFLSKVKGKSSVSEDVKALLYKLNLYYMFNDQANKLSGGEKRRFCLCMAFVGDPSILILDEPTSGLDPEGRHVIWNMLLKMRGRKTILISTHDMEEADILGDRIAIMHDGRLKSYGTPLFLKRLMGQNNVEIICSIGTQSDPERIRRELHKDGVITSTEPGKIVINVPSSPGLPDSLDNLEKKKKELGILGFSVSLISLEQVFLKITQENDDPPNPHQTIDSQEEKLAGKALYAQRVRALASKKLTYALRDHDGFLKKIFAIFLALLCTALFWLIFRWKEPEVVPISLGMYPKPEVLFASRDKNLGDRYETVSSNLGGIPTEVTNTDLESALLRRAEDNIILYENHVIAAAELDKNSVNAIYSETATFSLPISINLLGNAILQNLVGPDYSISVSSQELLYERIYADKSDSFASFTSISSLFFCLMLVVYVHHPSREFTTETKHLQRMTGVSGVTYWGAIFVFDLMEHALLMVLAVFGFVCIDLIYGFRLFGPTEIALEMLLLVLLGMSTLPFIYLLSFLKLETSRVERCLALIIFLPVIFDNRILSLSKENFAGPLFLIQAVSSWLPYLSFNHAQTSFFATAYTNARCLALPNEFYDVSCKDGSVTEVCCQFNCYNGKCEKSKDFFADDDEHISLKSSMLFLCFMTLLFIVILLAVENRRTNVTNESRDNVESDDDELVQREKSLVFQRIQTFRAQGPSSINNEQDQPTENDQDHQMFLVYELRKNYKDFEAVKDVSFSVNRGECFGLIGVNGAGKTTAFRMMTGGEQPDHGIMYVKDKGFEKSKKYCLSQMGYCPQHDAILESLNAYEHLRLFARLRGIPEDQVESQVQAWIDRLNLNSCALRQSGSYSGGNKRRLNIAMALIGNPNLIFMDEPTTGVDPAAKRLLWNFLKARQMAGQAVVLSSHSMDECEALCNRLAILLDGKLVCIGASEELKQRFGAGYDVQIKLNPEKAEFQLDDIKNDMLRMLDCEVTDENSSYLKFHVAPAGTTWRKMYNVMNEMKSQHDSIDDFLVLSSSLGHLFWMFAKSARARTTPRPSNNTFSRWRRRRLGTLLYL